MTAGLKIFNDAYINQVDDTFQNFVLIKSGEVTTGTNGYADVYIDYDGPVIFATACADGSTGSVQNRSGSTWHFYVGTTYGGRVVKWYAFAKPQNIPFNFGLRIFDERGNITFDSNQKPLIISYFFSIDTPLLPYVSGRDADYLPKEDEISPPQDIFIPLKQGHTYSGFPVKFLGAVSRIFKTKMPKGGYRSSYNHYCYMPCPSVGGILLKANPEELNSPSNVPQIRDFYVSRDNRNFIYDTLRVQQYWVIDVTGY